MVSHYILSSPLSCSRHLRRDTVFDLSRLVLNMVFVDAVLSYNPDTAPFGLSRFTLALPIGIAHTAPMYVLNELKVQAPWKNVAGAARSTAQKVGVVAGVLLVLLAFFLGSKRGKAGKTIVEVRRL